jgi:hypothetical protein
MLDGREDKEYVSRVYMVIAMLVERDEAPEKLIDLAKITLPGYQMQRKGVDGSKKHAAAVVGLMLNNLTEFPELKDRPVVQGWLQERKYL